MNGNTATAIGVIAFCLYAAISAVANAWADRATCAKCKADTAEK